MSYFIMFLACLSLDYVYTLWMVHVTKRNPVRAALYSALCVLIGYATTLSCVDNHWLIGPACAGHALGTVLAMRFSHDASSQAHAES